MEINKLKVKIGEHEFEAEGPTDVVQQQFAVFKELMLTPAAARTPTQPDTLPVPITPTETNNDLALGKIMKQDGRIVSLTARGRSVEEEIMLVLLGQKALRNNEAVTGSEIIDGLKLTGHVATRITYKLDKMTESGDVITVGSHRGRRYRLTNQGAAKVQELAKAVIATVA